MDFTLEAYRSLLVGLLKAGRQFKLHREYSPSLLYAPVILLRHDVDRIPRRSLAMGQLENTLGIRSTYYFRTKPGVLDMNVAIGLQRLGHEIGYHYEDMSDCGGKEGEAWASFQSNLDQFRPLGGVQTITMHGRPFSRWDNRLLWKSFDYRALGIKFEPYQDFDWSRIHYFTDTGRRWNSSSNVRDHTGFLKPGQALVRSTEDLLRFALSHPTCLVISCHPERWTDRLPDWLLSAVKDWAVNLAKRAIILLR